MYKATKLPNALYLSNLYTVDPDLVQKSKLNEIVIWRNVLHASQEIVVDELAEVLS